MMLSKLDQRVSGMRTGLTEMTGRSRVFMLNDGPRISTLTLATNAVQISHGIKTIEGKPSTDIGRHDSCNNPHEGN